MNDALGDRMKAYEGMEAGRRFLPMLPVYARIDGRGFSRFTKDMERPFDKRMSDSMIETTKVLVHETDALCGYCQSDEISLVWHQSDRSSQIFFDGRIQKMTSQLAALATVHFNHIISKRFPLEYSLRFPTFDCRVFAMPSQEEAANCFLWRELDATKNAVSMAARHYFSHKELMNKHGGEMQEMLWSKHNINFNDYPAFFKRGTFIQRKLVKRKYDGNLDDLPPMHHARRNPDMVIERHEIKELDMPPFAKVINRVGVIFNGEDPKVANDNGK